jgi:membrane associated rhomboid family serine protease
MNNAYNPFSLFPPVVKNILIITAIVFLAQNIFENIYHVDLSDYFGLHYYKGELFKPYQFITYIFLHGNLSHIFFNMLAVWMFGASLENYWGSKKFLTFYLLTGLGAALAQYLVYYFETQPLLEAVQYYNLHPSDANLNELFGANGNIKIWPEESIVANQFIQHYNETAKINPSKALMYAAEYLDGYQLRYFDKLTVIGASGSLFGLLGAYGMLFPNNIINIYLFIPIKAKYFVIIYGAIELFLGLRNSTGDNVAHFAHIGGLIVGIIIILIWRRK